MAFKYAERVQESSTSTGTGDLVLAGAPDSTYQTFSGAFANGDTTDVAIFGVGGFESCRATYNSGANSITRGARYASSNGGAAVNFGSGTKTIIVSAPGALVQPLIELPAWSTGDVKATFKTAADSGWIMMTDGTIGNASSGAGHANANAQALFTLLWPNTVLQLYNSSGTPISRGANAAADWAANCRLKLPLVLDRTLAGAGAGAGLTSKAIAVSDGSETHTQAIGELAAHPHGPSGASYIMNTDGNVGLQNTGGPYYLSTNVGSGSTASTGSSSPMNVLNPRTYCNYMIKL